MQQTLFRLIRQRYDIFIWKWSTSWENLFLSYVNYKGADQPAHARSLISAFVVRCLDSNEILQLKATERHCHIHCFSNLSVCGNVLSLHVHLFKSKFHPAGTVLHRFSKKFRPEGHCLAMIPRDGIFYPHRTHTFNSFFLHTFRFRMFFFLFFFLK